MLCIPVLLEMRLLICTPIPCFIYFLWWLNNVATFVVVLRTSWLHIQCRCLRTDIWRCLTSWHTTLKFAAGLTMLLLLHPFNSNWTTRGCTNSRTGHLLDWSTCGLDNSRTGQVADWTTRGLAHAANRTKTKHAKLPVASASCSVRDLLSTRVV